jgi:hypothetical protein
LRSERPEEGGGEGGKKERMGRGDSSHR